jgi:uncharacterized protein YndB with AHSA1/START domain
MTMQTADLTVRKTITVEAPQQRAFDVFTAGFDSWWPRSHHIGKAEMAEAIIECHEGGRAYERGVDGSECDWGRVLVWEPPTRLVLTWQINGRWQFDPDPEHASEIEVRFRSDGSEQTIVDLEPRLIDRLSDGQPLAPPLARAAAVAAPFFGCMPRPPKQHYLTAA